MNVRQDIAVQGRNCYKDFMHIKRRFDMAERYLVPDYILEYKCSCCTECCKRWRIIIDKGTVEKYDQLAADDEELSAMLNEGLQKDKTGKASVRLKDIVKKTTVEGNEEHKDMVSIDRSVCPFLGSEGLCAIQKKHGIDALSDTCKIFPRTIFKTGGVLRWPSPMPARPPQRP